MRRHMQTEEIVELKKIMKEKNLGYEEISKALNVSFQTVYRWMHGEFNPSKLALIQIKKFIRRNC